MKPTVRITGSAAGYLKRKLTVYAKSSKQYLRIVPAPGGLAGLVLDRARGDDEVIKVNGAPLLLVSSPLVPVLRGTVLDYQDTTEGSGLILSK